MEAREIGGGFFGSRFDCACGRRHEIEPATIAYAPGALGRLADIVRPASRKGVVAVLMDARTAKVGGESAVAALRDAGLDARPCVVRDRAGASPVCDDLTERELAAALRGREFGRQGEAGGPAALVTAGSGVVTDLGKWFAAEAGVPFVAVATAASMNGYTSANVAPTIGGLKTLAPGRTPLAVLAEPAVIESAPREMTAAGLGDVLAKSVSSADWLLNHRLFGDYYCARSVGLIADIEPLYMERPERLAARQPAAVGALFEALLLTGAAMTMAGTSAPASGGEHMVSHTLDMMSSLDARPHDLHGRQVGVGTILAAELYRRVLAVESPRFARPPEPDAKFWGPLAPAMADQWSQKLPRYEQAAAELRRPGLWDSLRAKLAGTVRPPEAIRDCLASAGAAHKAEHLGISPARLGAALRHAHEIRSRFTILDLAILLGCSPAVWSEAVDLLESRG